MMRLVKKAFLLCFSLLIILLMAMPCSAITKTLREKMTDPAVMELQRNLLVLGQFPLKTKTTNYFGSVTKAAVLKYQKTNALKADGLVSPKIFNKISDGANKKRIQIKAAAKAKLTASTTGLSASTGLPGLTGTNPASPVTTPALAVALTAVPETTPSSTASGDGSTTAADQALQDPATVSRGAEQNFLSHWFEEGQYLFPTGMDATVYDIGSGLSFRINHSMTSANHADSETKSAEDTRIMLAIWNGTFKSTPRPVILIVNGRAIAASVAGKPHCGLDALPFLAKLVNGDAYGDYIGRENCDKIKGNEMNGHFDVHFYKSRNHYNNLEDPAHQKNVLAADAWAKANLADGALPGIPAN